MAAGRLTGRNSDSDRTARYNRARQRMLRNFWKAALISLAAYVAAVLIGFWVGFQFTLFAVAVLQITWTLFCVI